MVRSAARVLGEAGTEMAVVATEVLLQAARGAAVQCWRMAAQPFVCHAFLVARKVLTASIACKVNDRQWRERAK